MDDTSSDATNGAGYQRYRRRVLRDKKPNYSRNICRDYNEERHQSERDEAVAPPRRGSSMADRRSDRGSVLQRHRNPRNPLGREASRLLSTASSDKSVLSRKAEPTQID
ncbi:unnamed protein product [Amoebophrya sp. A25]|nr:unnamed protein product [Amoebophrya sp. A25]|eukprot:GSA25T00014607001.1